MNNSIKEIIVEIDKNNSNYIKQKINFIKENSELLYTEIIEFLKNKIDNYSDIVFEKDKSKILYKYLLKDKKYDIALLFIKNNIGINNSDLKHIMKLTYNEYDDFYRYLIDNYYNANIIKEEDILHLICYSKVELLKYVVNKNNHKKQCEEEYELL